MVAVAVQPTPAPTTVRYHPRGASADLFRHHEPEVIVSGPAGTGKTYGALWRLHLAALKYPGMRGIMLRKVQEDLTASALVTYQERVLGAGNFGVRAYGGSKLTPAAFQYPNGSTLLIGGLDKPDKVMSREYDLIYVNEATEITEEDWEKLTTRARWGVMPYQQVYGDCNPQGPGHWLYKRAKAEKTTMLFSVHEDNPELFDPATKRWTAKGEAYIAKLDALTGFRRDRLRLGIWRAAEGVVYPAFSRETHVREVNTGGWPTIIGLDLGTRNPTAILTIHYSGDRIHVGREHYERGMSSDAITDAAVDAYVGTGSDCIVVDPSAAGLIASLQARGITAIKADNDVKVGISRVTSVLDDLTIDPSCENLITEFESYRYPDGRRDNSDIPVKEHDHAMDALRYAVMALTTPLDESGVVYYDDPVVVSRY
ncbi:MAG: terminase [Thermomicrobiales bacterium]|nr:terminase [Thermomicrobiales bacterium]